DSFLRACSFVASFVANFVGARLRSMLYAESGLASVSKSGPCLSEHFKIGSPSQPPNLRVALRSVAFVGLRVNSCSENETRSNCIDNRREPRLGIPNRSRTRTDRNYRLPGRPEFGQGKASRCRIAARRHRRGIDPIGRDRSRHAWRSLPLPGKKVWPVGHPG